MPTITEIAPDVYRICVLYPDIDLQFSHFLVKDDERLSTAEICHHRRPVGKMRPAISKRRSYSRRRCIDSTLGALLPCRVHLGVAADERAGMRTALLYLTYILGSASGSILVDFVLMDRLGLMEIAGTLVVWGLACAVLLSERCDAAAVAGEALQDRPRGRLGRGWSAGPSATHRRSARPPDADRHSHSQGASPGRGEPQQHHCRRPERGSIWQRYVRRPVHTDLTQDVNGILRPYALTLFHPAPRDVLMIGLSSGSWAKVMLPF
jgi:spermidine synthase